MAPRYLRSANARSSLERALALQFPQTRWNGIWTTSHASSFLRSNALAWMASTLQQRLMARKSGVTGCGRTETLNVAPPSDQGWPMDGAVADRLFATTVRW